MRGRCRPDLPFGELGLALARNVARSACCLARAFRDPNGKPGDARVEKHASDARLPMCGGKGNIGASSNSLSHGRTLAQPALPRAEAMANAHQPDDAVTRSPPVLKAARAAPDYDEPERAPEHDWPKGAPEHDWPKGAPDYDESEGARRHPAHLPFGSGLVSGEWLVNSAAQLFFGA